jgi:hypothetical protein
MNFKVKKLHLETLSELCAPCVTSVWGPEVEISYEHALGTSGLTNIAMNS